MPSFLFYFFVCVYGDMGFPFVCREYALLTLVVKEPILTHGLVMPGRKSEQRQRESRQSQAEVSQPPKKKNKTYRK